MTTNVWGQRAFGRFAFTGLLAVAVAAGGCQPKRPVVDFQDVRLKSAGTGRIGLLLEFRVFNTNLWDARLKEFHYVVRVADLEFVKGQWVGPARTFKALQWETIEVPAEILLENVPAIYQRSRQSGSLDGDLHCESAFQVAGIDIPVRMDKPLRMTKPHMPVWHFRTIRLPEGKTDKDNTMEVVFDVQNPNSFDLPTSGVKGRLLLGDSPLAEIDVPYPGAIPAHGRGEVVLRVQIKPPSLDRSSWRSWLSKDAVRFEGQFQLDHPISLREAFGERSPAKD